MAQRQATDAAKKAAEERDVDIASVEPTGSGGKVTVDDVMQAEAEPERAVVVKLADPLAHSATGSDGKTYRTGDTVPEKHFDEVLSKDKDIDGNRIFHRGGVA